MQHITLLTGHTRWSPREEVADDLMRLLVDHLALGLRERAPIPGQPAYVMHATADDGALVATVSMADGGVPVLSILTIPATHDAPAILRAVRWTLTDLPTPGPWCLVQIYPAGVLAMDPRDMDWIGDYERCLAWAWLESGTAQQTERH